MGDQAEYWWVSVAGNPCEPAVVKVEDGERRAWTLGCPDAFKLDAPDCPIVLVKLCADSVGIPLSPKETKEIAERQEQPYPFMRAHGYRRF